MKPIGKHSLHHGQMDWFLNWTQVRTAEVALQGQGSPHGRTDPNASELEPPGQLAG